MKKSIVVFTLFLLPSLAVHAMCDLYDWDDPRQQIDALTAQLNKDVEGEQNWSDEKDMFYWEYNSRVARIVREAGDRMPNKDKLPYLKGDPYFEILKGILKEMIEGEGENPNAINSGWDRPLYRSVERKDLEFTKYLLEHEAEVDDEIMNLATTPEIKRLLVESIKSSEFTSLSGEQFIFRYVKATACKE